MLYALAIILATLITIGVVIECITLAWRPIVGGLFVLGGLMLLPYVLRHLGNMPALVSPDVAMVLLFVLLPIGGVVAAIARLAVVAKQIRAR